LRFHPARFWIIPYFSTNQSRTLHDPVQEKYAYLRILTTAFKRRPSQLASNGESEQFHAIAGKWQPRTALSDYNDQVGGRIANAGHADDAIDESCRLGFLAASITESVDQGFEAFERDQAAQQALVGWSSI